jgi:hypothetical protein
MTTKKTSQNPVVEDLSFRQRLSAAPVDSKILARVNELGLGHRRGKGQAYRHLKKQPIMSARSDAEMLALMEKPLAFTGKKRLIKGCSIETDFPPNGTRKEIAFAGGPLPTFAHLPENFSDFDAGRANVGKSSLLNRLLGLQTGLPNSAKVEDSPGVTRKVTFYDIGKQVRLVDLPGRN